MRRRYVFVLGALFLATPYTVSAQVVISEFLYDAAGSDTGAEWVELYNAGGSPVDLTKWKINDGSNHVLNVPPKNGGIGSITLNSGAYIILADSAPNFIAQYPGVTNVIDSTLALPNTSGTISLLDDSGASVDSLSYTKDMGGAGDGTTLQRTSVAATTLTAGQPSPGSGTLSASGGSSSNTSTSDSSSTNQTTQTPPSAASPAVSSYVAPPVPQIFVDVGADRTVIVGADVEFDARGYDRDKKVLDQVRFLWNFGDGSTAEGEALLHHFDYPGRYAVMVSIAHDKSAATDEIIVTAEPAQLSFQALPDGAVAIQNLAGRDLDLSHWIVHQFGRDFILPDHSITLSGASMRISQKTLGFYSAAQAELQYPNGVTALHSGEATGAETEPTTTSVPPPNGPTSRAPARSGVISTSQVTHEAATDEDSPADPDVSDIATTTAQLAAAATSVGDSKVWWLAAMLLAFSACAALFTAKRLGKGEWDIVEE